MSLSKTVSVRCTRPAQAWLLHVRLCPASRKVLATAMLMAGLIGPGPCGALAAAPTGGAAGDTLGNLGSFWDRHVAGRSLLKWNPDSARNWAESLLARDPDDFLGRWMRGEYRAAHDPLAAQVALDEAATHPKQAGPQVEAGVILLARDDPEGGRPYLDRAQRAYAAAGRRLDECRALLWKFKYGWDRGNSLPADLAEAESLARAVADPATLADVLVSGAEMLGRSGHSMRRVGEMCREAITLLRPFGNGVQLVRAHRFVGRTLMMAGELDSASVQSGVAIELAHDLGDALQENRATMELGFVRKAQGAYPQALEVMNRALELARVRRDTSSLALSLQEVGTVLFEMGRLREAQERLEECQAVLQRDANVEAKVLALDALGLVEVALGKLESARRRFEQALAACRRFHQTERWFVPELLIHLAELNRQLGDTDAARAQIDEGLRVARTAGQKRVEVDLLGQKAGLLHSLGEHEDALGVTRQARRSARAVHPLALWQLGLVEAGALERLGRAREGLVVLDSALAMFPSVPDSVQLLNTLLLKGALHVRLGEAARALEACERGFAIAQGFEDPARIARARLALGAALVASRRPAEAAAMLEGGLGWFEAVQSGVPASEERTAYQTLWHDGYVWLARAYARLGRREMAFATLERSRARELRRLARSTAVVERRLLGQLPLRLARVDSSLTEAQALLLYAYSLPGPRRPTDLARLEDQVDSLRAARSALHRRLQREARPYAREVGLLPPIKVTELHRRLRSDERVMAFMVGTDGSLLFDLAHDSLQVREFAWGEDTLGRRVRQLLESVRAPAEPGARWSDLADTLLGGSGLSQSPPRRLYIVPDGPLHYLPFEALPLPAQGRGLRYVIELCEVVYGPSATLLFGPAGRSAPPATHETARLVGFGDPSVDSSTFAPVAGGPLRGSLPALTPLPFARREVLGLSKLFPGARVFVGPEATEARFFAELDRARIVHVAAHAFVDDRRPEFSGIVLSPTPVRRGGSTPDDGLVQAFEIMGRKLHLELATLSACETGRGSLSRGEGLLGLARAFRLAGARNLLVSLWKVDDAATAALMEQFYSRLGRGQAPAAALRGAKLALLHGDHPETDDALTGSEPRGVGTHERAESYAAPSAWAAFVLLGTGDR